MSTEEITGNLNTLLRGELSAIETYGQAMERIRDPMVKTELQRIVQDHQVAAGMLRKQIVMHGGQPAESSGPWGRWASVVTGAAKVIGESSVLKVLKEGEEHGVKEYRDALDKVGLDTDCRDVVQNDLLPKQESHAPTLDRYLSAS